MVENKNTTKGYKARQSKRENKKTPIVINLNSSDLYNEILEARQKAGIKLTMEEMAYLWTKALKPFGITIIVGKKSRITKPTWLKQLTRWIKSLANKF